jgi:hypothetical protein
LAEEELHMDQPDAGEALTRLEPFVGEWALEVTSPSGERLPGDGRCTFAWHESRAHLLQYSTIDVAEAPDAFCIIGCDAANGTYTQLYSDERGICRVYEMGLARNEWTLRREGQPFPQRFVATFSDDRNTITGRWEKAEDGRTFTTDFYLTYRRL